MKNEFTETIDGCHLVRYKNHGHKKDPWSLELRCSPRGLFIDHMPTLAAARNKARCLIILQEDRLRRDAD